MDDNRAKSYAARFDKVLDYIEANLGETLTVERLSQVANFSRFHFHRQFADYIGVGVARYIVLLRFRRASHQLVFNRGARVIDIALEAGFENPESFSRAFRHTFGRSPSDFRRNPDWEDWHTRYRFRIPERKQNVQVEIVDFETTLIAVRAHRGPVEKVNDSVAQFIEWRKASGLSPKNSVRTFGIAHDNPDTTEPAQFRFDVCGEVAAAVPPKRFWASMMATLQPACAARMAAKTPVQLPPATQTSTLVSTGTDCDGMLMGSMMIPLCRCHRRFSRRFAGWRCPVGPNRR